MVAGRAATAIYALLRSLFSGRDVVVPANICYAAVYPIVYSGNNPVFCDIADRSGNVSLDTIKKAMTGNVAAVVVPHMYGNPVSDIATIAGFCRKNGIVLIEDCASAMGASIDGKKVGGFGDFSVFSTGHAKIIDLQGGGVLFSDNDISRVKSILDELPVRDAGAVQKESEFSRVYRRFLNTRRALAEFPERDYFRRDFRDCYIYGCPAALRAKIEEEVNSRLNGEVSSRRERFEALRAVFESRVGAAPVYDYAGGSVPWRFSFFVDGNLRQAVADALLKEGIPVSDWYPTINELFGDGGDYPSAYAMGREILNLPLAISDRQFEIACQTLAGLVGRRQCADMPAMHKPAPPDTD